MGKILIDTNMLVDGILSFDTFYPKELRVK